MLADRQPHQHLTTLASNNDPAQGLHILKPGPVASRAWMLEAAHGTTLWSTYKLYDLQAIFYSRLSVSESIFMFPQVIIFLLFFCGGPLVVEAPGQLPSLPPPLKSGPAELHTHQLVRGSGRGRNMREEWVCTFFPRFGRLICWVGRFLPRDAMHPRY